MIDTEALRKKVLDLAIQGKLTEQLPSDGTAEELYAKIQEEKARLIKESRIKKEKPLPAITEKEIPFDIPKNWKWVRLASIYEINPKVEADNAIEAAFIPMEKISQGFIRDFSYDIQDWGTASKNHTKFQNDDVAFAKITPCFENRKSFIAKNLPNGIGGGTTELIILRQKHVLPEYTYYIVTSQRFIDAGSSSYKGVVGQQRVKSDIINRFLLPLPPLEEQKRIVSKIDEIFAQIDIIDDLQSKYINDNAVLKSKLLDAAIRGRLVEQRAEEGTAEELYKQIRAEKQKLIKEGKIKKEKPLPEITEDEIPFDIPESWKWVKLGDCTSYAQTKEKISPSEITPNMWSLDLEDIQKETGTILVRTMASERKITGDKVKFRKKQVLYSKLRPYLKKILVAPDDGICTSEIVPFDAYLIDEKYLVNVLKSPYVDHLINSVTYGIKMPRVGTDTMTNLLIPLPPLAEQRRIVAKIEELLPLCERLAECREKA